MFRYLSIFLFLGGNVSFSFAQSILKTISGNQINRNVIEIQWTTKAGNTCSDLRIERSLNAEPYTEVYRFNGICGIADAEQFYSYFDTIQYNGNYAYRINENSGTYSDSIQIQAFTDALEIVIYPNPANAFFSLRSNTTSKTFRISLLSKDGKFVINAMDIYANEKIPIGALANGHYTLFVEEKDRRSILLLVKN